MKRWFGCMALAVVVGGLWLARWDSGEARYMGDSYRYAVLAYERAGEPQQRAETDAMTATCAWLASRRDAVRFPAGCVPGLHGGVAPYVRIFQDRVGFPAAVAVLIPLLGVNAFAAVTCASVVVAALALARLVRQGGGSRPMAVASAVAVCCVPGTAWLARVGTEAPALAAMLAAAVAAVSLRRRVSAGAALGLAAATSVLLLVRPPSAIAFVAALAAGAVFAAARTVGKRDMAVATLHSAVLLGLLTAQLLRHGPGIGTTLQDTFTHHFHNRPVVGLPLRYLHLLTGTLHDTFASWLTHPVTPAVIVLGTVVALRDPHVKKWGWPIVAAGAALVHPLATEIPRLLSPCVALTAVGWGRIAALPWRRAEEVTNPDVEARLRLWATQLAGGHLLLPTPDA